MKKFIDLWFNSSSKVHRFRPQSSSDSVVSSDHLSFYGRKQTNYVNVCTDYVNHAAVTHSVRTNNILLSQLYNFNCHDGSS